MGMLIMDLSAPVLLDTPVLFAILALLIITWSTIHAPSILTVPVINLPNVLRPIPVCEAEFAAMMSTMDLNVPVQLDMQVLFVISVLQTITWSKVIALSIPLVQVTNLPNVPKLILV